MAKRYDFIWEFPLPRVHTGMLLGNGLMGVMIWGQGDTLCLTLGRSDWWDHRGGKAWTAAMNWRDIRRLLEAGDETSLRAIFAEPSDGGPKRPTLMPVGRFELKLPAGARLSFGKLDRFSGTATIEIALAGRTEQLTLALCVDRPLLRIDRSAGLREISITPKPAYETAGRALADRGIAAPTRIDRDGVVGFVQPLPKDDALAAVAVTKGPTTWISTDRRPTADAALPAAVDAVNGAGEQSLEPSQAWWADYWQRTPRVSIPNPTLQFLYDYGLYKFAGLTNPLGYPAGLQGPWIEDYATPPWSGDYHFNINVQMCYGPAYACNHLSHLRPLFDLIWSWRNKLRDHAHKFIGIDDGLMLPHAVDDRCAIVGNFWTGTIDHGCTAWVGKMMYDFWSFGGADDKYARDVVFPFLHGAMRVYEEMLDRDGDGFVLPVSVSPEYRGAAMNAWGKNASFQLACIHYLCEKLIDLAGRLGEKERPIWRELLAKLPRATVDKHKGYDRLFHWQGTVLEESHRHHSHLVGINPFDVIDPSDPQWSEVVKHSINHWIGEGPGLWSGWCVPWASQLHLRVGNAGMAELYLEIWERVFTNIGHGTLHDCEIDGFTLMGAGGGVSVAKGRRNEIMQMDAGMGAVSAITDLLLHTRRGVHYLFAGCPNRWEDVSFESLRTEGGFLISAARTAGKVTSLKIEATRPGTFRYADPASGEHRSITLAAGQKESLV